MKNATTETEKQGRRYWIETEVSPATAAHPSSATATMRHASRKTTWAETRATRDAAVEAVLRFLRDDLRPFVRVDPGAPAPAPTATAIEHCHTPGHGLLCLGLREDCTGAAAEQVAAVRSGALA